MQCGNHVLRRGCEPLFAGPAPALCQRRQTSLLQQHMSLLGLLSPWRRHRCTMATASKKRWLQKHMQVKPTAHLACGLTLGWLLSALLQSAPQCVVRSCSAARALCTAVPTHDQISMCIAQPFLSPMLSSFAVLPSLRYGPEAHSIRAHS